MLYFDDVTKRYTTVSSVNNGTSPKPWEKKFAWFPRNIKGKLVWLDYYYRRMVWSEYNAGYYTDHEWRHQYGTILDVLAS